MTIGGQFNILFAMEPNVIIRFETTEQIGIYQANLLRRIGMTTAASPRHPMPDEEDEFLNRSWHGSYYFGFDSVKKLLNWFSLDEIAQLVDLQQFQIRLIRASDVISSKSQAAYRRTSISSTKILDKNEFVSILKGNPTWVAQEKLNGMIE